MFDEVITVDVMDSEDRLHLALLGRPELGSTFTKIHCWTLTQYSKCVFLDADTLVSLLNIQILLLYVSVTSYKHKVLLRFEFRISSLPDILS